MSSVLDTIRSNDQYSAKGGLIVNRDIGSNAKVESSGRCSVKGNIGSSAQVTVTQGEITIEGSIGSNAKVESSGRCSVKGNIGSSAQVTVTQGEMTIEGSIGSNAKVKSSGRCSVKGNIGSSAQVTVTQGEMTIEGSIGSNAKVESSSRCSVKGNIGSSAEIKAGGDLKAHNIGSNAKVTADGNVTVAEIASRATIFLTNPACLQAQQMGVGVNIVLVSGGSLDIQNSIALSESESENISTLTDQIAKLTIKIHQSGVSKQVRVLVNGYEVLGGSITSLNIIWKEGQLFLDKEKIEVNSQGLRNDGQQPTADSLGAQAMGQNSYMPFASLTAPDKAANSSYSSYSSAFFPSQNMENQKEPSNQTVPLLPRDKVEEPCCCLLM